jgi:hypothetical protein
VYVHSPILLLQADRRFVTFPFPSPVSFYRLTSGFAKLYALCILPTAVVTLTSLVPILRHISSSIVGVADSGVLRMYLCICRHPFAPFPSSDHRSSQGTAYPEVGLQSVEN